jgi:type III pantothenate kinase
MLLAIDIGNTNIVVGILKDDKILYEARIATDRIKTSDQYGVEIKNILSLYDTRPEDIEDCIISSVVPPVFNSVRTGVVKVIRKEPLVVGPGMKTGLNIKTDIPSQVGSDRIVVAVAALAEHKPPFALLDLGTATTIDVVDGDSNYIGGCILPGVRISLEALTSRTAQLPGINLDTPGKVIGKNTVDCMRSGIMYGTAAQVDGLLERMEEELGEIKTVIATGGMAQFIVPLCRREIQLDKDLLLKGLNILYKKNAHEKRRCEEVKI